LPQLRLKKKGEAVLAARYVLSYVRDGGFTMDAYEAVIIGGGPAGLTAGIYLMRAGISTLLLEKQLLGGAPMNTEHIENYPGFPDGISGAELMGKMAEQARKLGLPIAEFSEVGEARNEEGTFVIRTEKDVYRSLGLILAMGTEPAKLNIPGEDMFVGKGISYCATCDGMFFRGMEVAVVGGGDSALSEALTLANITSRVYVVHRREQFRAQRILQDRAERNSKIEFLLNKVPVSVNGKDLVESLTLRDALTREESVLPLSGVFFYVGSHPGTAWVGPLADIDPVGFVVTDEGLETKTKGMFAAGDVRKKSLRQITTAVGDGALAAVNLEKYVLEKR
jgi:thioredoxin reductase (NADPH)